MGHLQNELSACNGLCHCVCMHVHELYVLLVKKLNATGDTLPPSPFSHFMFLLNICQDHMTAP